MSEQSLSSERPAPRRRVIIIGSLLLMLVSGILALGLGEIVVRLAAPQQLIIIRPDIWVPADTIGWRLGSNVSTSVNTGERTVTLRTDAEGFRIGADGRSEGSTEILLIGDSFTEAIQVEYEDTFGALLERGLGERLGQSVAVRNAGVSDWSPNNYLLRARQLLARDTFALVVVAVFVGNDAVNYRVDHVPPRNPAPRRTLRMPREFAWRELVYAWLAPVNDALEVRSHLFVLLKNQFAGLRMKLGVTADYFPPEFLRSEASSPRWALTGDIAADIAQAVAAHGIETLFVLIPERVQVQEEDFERAIQGFGIARDSVELDQPSRLLREAFEARGLRTLDVLSDFRNTASDTMPLYGSVDQHLSPAGHRRLAELMLPELVRMLSR